MRHEKGAYTNQGLASGPATSLAVWAGWSLTCEIELPPSLARIRGRSEKLSPASDCSFEQLPCDYRGFCAEGGSVSKHPKPPPSAHPCHVNCGIDFARWHKWHDDIEQRGGVAQPRTSAIPYSRLWDVQPGGKDFGVAACRASGFLSRNPLEIDPFPGGAEHTA